MYLPAKHIILFDGVLQAFKKKKILIAIKILQLSVSDVLALK